MTASDTRGRSLEGVRIDQTAPIRHCGTCGAEIWWGFTRMGRRCPFDVVGEQRTAVTHFSTCPSAKLHSKR